MWYNVPSNKEEGENMKGTKAEMITITQAEYDGLFNDSVFLGCLEDAGVDNWCGYEDAKDMMEELCDD